MNLLIKLILVVKVFHNFPTAILDKLGLLNGEVIYKFRNSSLQLIARTGTEDLAEIAVVGSGSEYNFKHVSFSKNPIIVDLGGHIGSFSIPTSLKFKNKCRIFAFEAEKSNYKFFLRNIKLNKTSSIYVKNIAISNFIGKGLLKTNNMNTDAYYLVPLKNKKSNCNVKTLPDALREYKISKIDILKMDIEGEEYKIFKHKLSLEYIKKTVKYIFIEVDPKYEKSQMKKIIDKNFKTLNNHNNVLTLVNTNKKND